MIWQSEGSRMRDLFVEDGPDSKRATLSPDAAQEIRDAIAGRNVCPFCGAVREQSDGPCARCTMENTSASRQATKARIGPWYVFQSRNPAAPGMKYETLLGFIHKGRVKARSVVRGPTTHQLWRFAAHVKGLSREFGICYSCGGAIERTAGLCPHCNRLQEPPANPDVFIEGQEPEPASKSPVMRDVGPTPMAAEDVVAPPLGGPGGAAQSEAADDARGKKSPPADGFLSPQDLAAAFNLDFRPRGGRAQQQQQQSQGSMQLRRKPPQRRPRRWGRRLFVLFLLAAIGGVAYAMVTKPLLRAQAIDWSNKAVAWTRQKVADLRQPPAKPAPTKSTDAQSLPEIVVTPPDAKGSAEQPATSSKADAPPPPVKPSPWDSILGQQGNATGGAEKSTGADKASSPATTPAQPPAARADRPRTIEEMWAIYRDAVDAQGQGNFAGAVKKYEQIKEFPPELRPRDLDLRLSEARRQMQQ